LLAHYGAGDGALKDEEEFNLNNFYVAQAFTPGNMRTIGFESPINGLEGSSRFSPQA
jgi:hypothetical protein